MKHIIPAYIVIRFCEIIFSSGTVYAQPSSDIAKLLGRVNEAVQNIKYIELNIVSEMKYLMSEDTVCRVTSYQLTRDTSTILGYHYHYRSEDQVNWSCNKYYYEASIRDSNLLTFDESDVNSKLFTKERINAPIVRWLSPDFTESILNNKKIISYDLDLHPKDSSFILRLDFKPLHEEITYYYEVYKFDATSSYLEQFSINASYDGLDQFFDYKINVIRESTQAVSFCHELNTFLAFELTHFERREGVVSKLDSLKNLPSFKFKSTSEKTYTSDEIDTLTLLYFWYQGCIPCRLSGPKIDSLFDAFNGRGVSIWGVNPVDSREEIVSYLEKKKFDFPSFYDTKSYCELIGMTGYPTILVLDRDLNIVIKYNGYSSSMFSDLKDSIYQKLKSSDDN